MGSRLRLIIIEALALLAVLCIFVFVADAYFNLGIVRTWASNDGSEKASAPMELEVIYTSLSDLDPAVADAFLQDTYIIERSEPVRIQRLTWEEDPYQDNYWRFVFYSLRQTNHLLNAWVDTKDPRYLDRLNEIVSSFLDTGMAKPYAWEDKHSVAYRAMTLTNIYKKLERQGGFPSEAYRAGLLDAIRSHGEFLAEDYNYEADYNHGVTQAAALLLVAVNFPEMPESPQWLETARQRVDSGLVEIVAADGVLIENSPYYHFYVLEKYWVIYRYSNEFGIHISDHFEDRIRKMIRYATYILQPDASMPLLGASLERRINNSGVYAEMSRLDPNFRYVLTGGAEGDAPPRNLATYPDAGQSILRSGWSSGEEFKNQTQIVFDIGPYRTNHSDLDALSFSLFGNGLALMPDAGLYTYDNGPFRDYFHGSLSHNLVVVDGKSQKEGSPIVGQSQEGDGWSYSSAQHNLYDGVTHQRAIALLGSKYVVVVDNLLSETSHQYEQLFHLFPGAAVDIEGLRVTGTGDSPAHSITIHQVLKGGITVEQSTGELSPPKGLCSSQYGVHVPCSMISYEQSGTNVQYVTLLEIGQPQADLGAVYQDGMVRLRSGNAEYILDVSLGTSPIRRDVGVAAAGSVVQRQVLPGQESVVIVFDDGYKSILPAAEVMHRYGIKGNAAIISGQVGKLGYLSLDDVKMLQDVYGWNIVNHSREHKNAVLTYSPGHLPGLESDILDGAQFLVENGLNSAPNWYVYPFGATSDEVKAVIGRYYGFARTTGSGQEAYPFRDPLGVRAFSVNDATPLEEVLAVVDKAMADNTIQFLTFHRIQHDPPRDEKGGYPIQDFERLIARIAESKARVLTLRELDEVNGVPQAEWSFKETVPPQIALQVRRDEKGLARRMFGAIVGTSPKGRPSEPLVSGGPGRAAPAPTPAAAPAGAPSPAPHRQPPSTPAPTATPGPTRRPAQVPAVIPVQASMTTDEGTHGAPVEWWHFNGHLVDERGEEHSFHVVAYQQVTAGGVKPQVIHASFTDHTRNVYQLAEKLVDPPAQTAPDSFSLRSQGWHVSGDGVDYILAFDLRDYSTLLRSVSRKPAVLNQRTPLIKLGPAGEGYAYSRTRLETVGTLRVGKETRTAKGTVWLEHRWGDLDTDAVGWDWTKVHFDDGSDLMAMVVWDAASRRPVAAYGTYVAPDGAVKHLASSDMVLKSTSIWTSPSNETTYGSGWTLAALPLSLVISLEPVHQGAEFTASSYIPAPYWEGAVTVRGTKNGAPVGGMGFVELAGYASGRTGFGMLTETRGR